MKHDDIVTELIEYLPSNTPKNVYALCEHIRSPQFQQAVATFDAALSSGQLSGLMQSIGLDPSVGGPFGGLYCEFYFFFLSIFQFGMFSY